MLRTTKCTPILKNKLNKNNMISRNRASVTILIVFAFLFHSVSPVFAQNSGYLEDESSFLWEQQEYKDSTGREFETTDTQYVGEQEIKEAEEAARLSGRPSVDLAAALEKDKELLPDNIIYGIGTGSVIGGWLALVQGKNARDNVRFLSVGVIAGILLGMAVGSKSLYIQQSPSVFKLDLPDKKTGNPIPVRLGFVREKSRTLPQLNLQFKF